MKLIILDFDGTLADTRGLIVKTMQQTLDALGLESRTDDQCAAMMRACHNRNSLSFCHPERSEGSR